MSVIDLSRTGISLEKIATSYFSDFQKCGFQFFAKKEYTHRELVENYSTVRILILLATTLAINIFVHIKELGALDSAGGKAFSFRRGRGLRALDFCVGAYFDPKKLF